MIKFLWPKDVWKLLRGCSLLRFYSGTRFQVLLQTGFPRPDQLVWTDHPSPGRMAQCMGEAGGGPRPAPQAPPPFPAVATVSVT